jgi:hypothetical protein
LNLHKSFIRNSRFTIDGLFRGGAFLHGHKSEHPYGVGTNVAAKFLSPIFSPDSSEAFGVGRLLPFPKFCRKLQKSGYESFWNV